MTLETPFFFDKEFFCVFLGHFTCNMGSYFQDCGCFSLFNWNLVCHLFFCLCTCPCTGSSSPEQGSVGQNWVSWWGRDMKASFISAIHLKIKYSTGFGLGQTMTSLTLWADLYLFRGKLIETHMHTWTHAQTPCDQWLSLCWSLPWSSPFLSCCRGSM